MKYRPFQTVKYGNDLIKIVWTKKPKNMTKTIQESIEVAKGILPPSEWSNASVWRSRFVGDNYDVFIGVMNNAHVSSLVKEDVDVS